MRSTLLATAALAGLTLTACGSTVQQQGLVQYGDQGLGGSTGSVTQPTDSSTDTGTTGGSTSGGTSGSTTGSSAVTSSNGGSPSSPGTSTSGSTSALPAGGSSGAVANNRKPIEVGVLLFPDVAAASAALGGKSGNADGQEGETKAAVSYLNAHGGLGGRQIKLIVHNVSLTSTESYASLEQEACTDFTQDHHVSVVMTVGASIDNSFPTCLAKYHVLNVAGGHYLHDETDYRNVPNLVTPSEVSTTRVGKTLVQQLLTRSTLKRGDKLAMLVEDEPGARRALDHVWTPELQAAGIKVFSYVIKGPSSTADIANSVTAISNAELKAASVGAKGVAFICAGCYQYFEQSAEQQGYYPQYILSSLDKVGGAAGGNHGKSMANAIAIGWDPLQDVGGFTHAKEFTGNPTRDLCHVIEKGYVTDDTSEFISQTVCGGFLDLLAAANTLKGAAITGDSLMQGFNALGASHPSAVSFRTQLDASHHDGAAAYRTMHYDAATDAFVYDNHTLHAFLQ